MKAAAIKKGHTDEKTVGFLDMRRTYANCCRPLRVRTDSGTFKIIGSNGF
jgi:hypothetical protein